MAATTKVCPKCRQTLTTDSLYCPHDGAELKIKSRDRYCSHCGNHHGEDGHCPAQSTDQPLPTVSLSGQVLDEFENLEIMDHQAQDAFSRELCPKCGAWKNWHHTGNVYTCQSCSETFVLKDKKLHTSKIPIASAAEMESADASPIAKILSAIDETNKKYWLNQFDKLDSVPNYKRWNWPSFFLDVYRYLWKGMWKKGLIVFAIFFAAAFSIGVIEALINPESSGGEKYSPVFIILYAIIVLIVKVYMGTKGSKDYYNHVKSFGEDVEKAKKNQTLSRIILVIVIVVSKVLELI